MADMQNFLALDWVKGEIDETLKQARQALEAYVENPEDSTRMRFCLAYLHQVFGTLHMVEFYGAALLAEEMEKLCLALINGQVSRVEDGQEVLMRAILQLPQYLERVKASRRDLPVVVLPLLNDLRAVRGEPLLSETALFKPDLAAGSQAPVVTLPVPKEQVPVLLKKLRQAFQMALLGVIRNDRVGENYGHLANVLGKLERLAAGAPVRELWQIGAAVVEGLSGQSIEAGSSIKMLLGQIDRQLKRVMDQPEAAVAPELLKNLLYYVAKAPSDSPRIRAVKSLYRLAEALPAEALINEERARMAGPDREAMRSVVDALCEELARVKDALDLFVRAPIQNETDLKALVPTLKQVADTVAVLGLGQQRRIVQEQIEVIDAMVAGDTAVEPNRLLDVAGALLYIEASLQGMVADKPMAVSAGGEVLPAAADQLSDAQSALLRESRSALEKAKEAVVEFIASQWNPESLSAVPELLSTVRGGLAILGFQRSAQQLGQTARYVSERLLGAEHRPDWPEMDTLADVISAVEYYLERVANDALGGENILDIAERGLRKLGYGSAVAAEVETEAEAAPAVLAEVAGIRFDELSLIEPLAPELATLEPALMAELEAESMPVPEPVMVEAPAETAPELTVAVGGAETAIEPEALALTTEPSESMPAWPELSAEEEAPTVELEAELAVDELELPTLDLAVLVPEAAVAAVAPAVAAKPLLPVLIEMPVDDHDFDEEIREIFVEEAAEVLETISEYFPRWAANFEQRDALIEFRRGFHTLKGSGRMVGAKVVGELAWAVESMLNKVRDNLVQPDQIMVNLISECLAVIPGLVEDFQNRQPPRVNTSPLMAAAEALARGESLSALDVAQAAAQAYETEAEEDVSAACFDALAASLSPAEPETIEAVSLERVAEEWLPEADVVEVADVPVELVPVMPDVAAEPLVDPVLLEIFVSEAETHQADVAEFLSTADGERNTTPITDNVLRALHTLKGSAGMAGIQAVAEVSAPTEHLFKDLRNQGSPARREHIDALRQAHALIDASIADLQQGGNGQIAGMDELIQHIRQLDQDRLAQLEAQQAETLELNVPRKGVVATLLELGIDHVLDAPDQIEQWEASEDVEALVQLRAELARLVPAANQVGVTPMAALAEAMGRVHERLARDDFPYDVAADVLHEAHEEIIGMLDTLAACLTVDPVDDLVERLDALVATPLRVVEAVEPAPAGAVEAVLPEAAEPAMAAAAPVAEAEAVDSELLEIFLEEAEETLEAAEAALNDWLHNTADISAIKALQRHLHTLKGGARLAMIVGIGDLAHELEYLYEGLVDGRFCPTPALEGLLHACHGRLATMVAELRRQGHCAPAPELVQQVMAFRSGDEAPLAAPAVSAEPGASEEAIEADSYSLAGLEAELAELAGAEAMPGATAAEEEGEVAVAAPVTAVALAPVAPVSEFEPNYDPELLEIFLEEADEILEATANNLQDWLGDTHNLLPVQELQRGLHTLKGGARMAEIGPLGNLAHHLENLYEGICEGRFQAVPTLFGLLHACHDRLQDAVDALKQRQTVPATDDLIQQIQGYIADPHNFQATPTAVTLTPYVPEPVAPAAAVATPLPIASVEGRAIEPGPLPEQVDADVLEIFVEEAEELTEGIERTLNTWLDARDQRGLLDELMRLMHTLKGGARLAGLRELGDLAHGWEADLIAVQNGVQKADDDFFTEQLERQERVLKLVRGLKTAAGVISAAMAEAAPASVVEPAPAAPVVPLRVAPRVPRAPGERPQPPVVTRQTGDAARRGPQEMIRVPSDLLEKLVNLAGETSIIRARVEQGVHGFAQTVEEMGATIQRLAEQLRRMDAETETQIMARHEEELAEAQKYEDFDPLEMDQYSQLHQLSRALSESASDLLDLKATLIDKARDTETLLLQQSRINTELQEGLMRSRMVPFSRLVPRLRRIVRQTGQEVGKPADLEVINPEGEMDRTLLERVVAPLEHMLRNAVDHGIEKPEPRAAAGKPAEGRVTLALSREGNEVVLTLRDDGAGINVEAVRRKALERGLIAADNEVTDAEVMQFIFHAGFSTAEKVTQISGRGVGMDVVQSEIKQMGGTVSISSTPGSGTTFIIRLPFTVAVNRALMVRIGEDIYAVPLTQVEGIVRASPYELETYYGPDAPLFEYASVAYKLHYLGEFVHGVKAPNLIGHLLPLPVLLIRGGEQRTAIQVDALLGSREVVVKSVGAQLASVAGISGATILGDGSVVIILDIVAMLRSLTLRVPRLSAVAELAPAVAAPALPSVITPVVEARVRTVMVVDDSVTVRKVTSRLLERHGYHVITAKDGVDAVGKLEDSKPDIMLLDIEMPRMDGYEVASLVRHNPHLEDIPIIMITSRTGEKHRERAFQIGVNCYMGKPFQEQELLGTVSELIAAHPVRR